MIGTEVSHYKILERIGGGGMGVVYKAQDLKLERIVALKFLPPELTRDPDAKLRFVHEAKAASALDHANICTIHEIDETRDGQSFIVMAYYGGETLKARIERGPLGLDDALEIAQQVAAGLARAHEAGMVHRDIKPANVMVTERKEVKIVDFGLAKLGGQTKLTQTGTTLGTFAYMAPEQVRGEEADHRSDLWSLGVVLHELLTGRLPFKGEFQQAMAYSILNEPPEPATSMRSGLPVELDRVIGKALSKRPDERYQHADELLADIKRLRRESEPGGPSVVAVPEKKRPSRLLIGAAALVALIAAAFLVNQFLFQPAIATEPVPIAVISFENQTGDPSYDYLSKAIPNLLITSLEQSSYLQVTTWERMRDLLKQLGKDTVQVIDRELGYELCRMDGVDAIVLGSFVKAGDQFATDVKVLDVETKKLIHSASTRGKGEGSIIESQIDELSGEISEGVGLSGWRTAEAARPVAEVTTHSLEAYNYYLRGRDDYYKFYFADAVRFLEKAIELDSTFAMAYLYLGQAQAGRDNIRARDANYVKAMELSMRATEKERLVIEAFYVRNVERDQEKYFKILQKLRQDYPKEKRVFILLALYYDGRDSESEIGALRAALELDPDYGDALNMMGYAHANMGNYAEALKYLERYARVIPGEANPYDSMAEIYFHTGDLDKAVEKYEEAIAIKPGFLSCFPVSYICALREDYDAALEWMNRFSSTASDSGEVAMAEFWRGLLHYWTGSREEALREVRESRRLWGVVGNRLYRGSMDKIIAWILLDGGDPEAGLEIFDQDEEFRFKRVSGGRGNLIAHMEFYRSCCALERGEIDSAAFHAGVVKSSLPDVLPDWQDQFTYQSGLLDAAVWLARGNADSAVALCNRAVPSGLIRANPEVLSWYMIGFLYRPNCDVLGRAYLKKGELENAIAEYERLTRYDPTGPDRRWIRPENHYALARLYEGKGMTVEAVAEYEEFLRIWQNADRDLPEKRDATRRLAALRPS
jgi:serine/threonine protein kinase/predicted Zn-dependent protease